jgi:hypothetical protein
MSTTTVDAREVITITGFAPPIGQRPIRIRPPRGLATRWWKVTRGPDAYAPNARMLWTAKDDAVLWSLRHHSDLSCGEIAKTLGRSYSSVCTRLTVLRHRADGKARA